MVAPSKERRKAVDAPRLKTPSSPVTVTFRKKLYDGRAQDVSKSGVCVVAGPLNKGSRVTVTFAPGDGESIVRKGTVKWCKGDSLGIELAYPLHDDNVRTIILGTERQKKTEYDLAKEDYREVWEQTRSIQRCRSRIFISSIAALGAAAMTTGVILSRVSRSNPGSINEIAEWVLLGSVVGGLLLTIGILATVEKARAINIRTGFLAALTEYLRTGQAPPNYNGWAQLQDAQFRCGHRRDNGMCPPVESYKEQKQKKDNQRSSNPQTSKQQDLVSPQTCWTIGLHEATTLSKAKRKRLVPGAFDSFMSLSGFLYSAAYFLTFSVFLIALGCYLTDGARTDVPVVIKYSLLGLALGALLCLLEGRLRSHKKHLNQRNIDRTDISLVLARFLIVSALVAFVAIILAGAIGDWRPSTRGVAAGLAGALVAWVGVSLVRQLEKVRRGLYSFEALSCSWRRCLLACHFDPEFKPRIDIERDIAGSRS